MTFGDPLLDSGVEGDLSVADLALQDCLIRPCQWAALSHQPSYQDQIVFLGVLEKDENRRAPNGSNTRVIQVRKLPFYPEAGAAAPTFRGGSDPLFGISGVYMYRGTSLIRNSSPLAPYSRTMPRALWRS